MTATSEGIPNKGQKRLKLKTREGHKRQMTVQVANVRKPLISTAKLNDAGNDVNLHHDKPHIINRATGERSDLRRVGRAYLLDLWVWIDRNQSDGTKKDDLKTTDFSGRR